MYPKWTFSPAIKKKEVMSSVRKMDENGGVWIRTLSLRKRNIAWILSFVEPRFSINMWDCVCIFDMNLEMKQ